MSAVPRFESLITPHLTDLRKFCLYLTKSKWDAEDLYQEALLKAMLYVRNVKSDRVTKSFLFSAAKLLWIDRYRNAKKKADAEIMISESYMDIDYVTIRSTIEWLAERIPDRNVEMWLLSEYFGYSMQDIADGMNTTVPAVKSGLHRTRESIRRERHGQKKRSTQPRVVQVERWVRAVMWEQPQQICSGRG